MIPQKSYRHINQGYTFFFLYSHTKYIKIRDFSDGLGVNNPPSNAGDMSSISGRGTKIPHAIEQPSPQTANF